MGKRKVESEFINTGKRKLRNFLGGGRRPESESEPVVEEVIDSLKAFSDTTYLNKLVDITKQQLKDKNSGKRSRSASVNWDKGSTSASVKEQEWKCITESGFKLLNFVNHHTKTIEDKEEILHLGYSTIVSDILEKLGKLHWAVGGLAIAAYLIKKFEKVSENKAAAFELVSNMVDLATTVVKLNDVIEEEKLNKAATLVVQGSIMCICQIQSPKIFSFFKTSVDAKNLKKTSKILNHLYRDLDFAITAKILKLQAENQSKIENSLSENQSKIEKRFSEIEKRLLQIEKGLSETAKRHAVGIGKAQEEMNITAENLTPSPPTPVK